MTKFPLRHPAIRLVFEEPAFFLVSYSENKMDNDEVVGATGLVIILLFSFAALHSVYVINSSTEIIERIKH